MDVRLPDGTVVTNVPEGITQSELMTRLGRTVEPSSTPPKAPATPEEKVMGHPLARFAMGTASPVAGLFQLGANVVGAGEPVNKHLSKVEQMKRRGMEEYGAETDVAGTLGTMMSPPVLKAASAVPLAASTLGKVAQGAGLGGLFGLANPVTEEGDFAQQKAGQVATGAAVGGALPPLISGGAAIGRAARNVVDPWLPGGAERVAGRIANAAAGDKRDTIVQALMQNRQIVPGSQGHAGEVAAPAGSAEFSGLQKIATSLKPTAYNDMSKAQDQARVSAVRSVSRDKTALQAAEGTRSGAAAHNYGEAAKGKVKSDASLQELMSRPSMEKVMARARDLAEERGEKFVWGRDVPAQTTPGSIVGKSGEPLTQTTTPAQFAEYPVNSLHYMKMAMDDLIKNPERFGIGSSEQAAITATRGKLVDWIGQKSPAYDFARSKHARLSEPINQMQVGQFLESKLVAPIAEVGEGAVKQRAALYAQALRDAPGTMKKSTGQPRYTELSEVLKPDQVGSVTNVAKDLGRRAEYENLARLGGQQANTIIKEQLPTAPAAGMFNPNYSVARAMFNRLVGKASKDALDQLAVKMQNPQEMARLMQLSPPQRQKVIEALLHQAGRASSAGVD